MSNKEVIESLHDYREWAESNIFDVPIDLPDILSNAADIIENMEKHIAVLQQEVGTYRRRAEYLTDTVFVLLERWKSNMRDPSRIQPFCERLAKLWSEKVPDWRFMQLVSNLQSAIGNDGFYIEDDHILEILDAYLEGV